MQRLFSTHHSIATDAALLLARLVIAAMMLTHGLPKVGMLFSGEVTFPAVFGLSPTVSLALTLFAQVVCSLFLALGLGTRLAALPLFLNMLVAVVVVHHADPFAKTEPALHFLLVYAVLLLAGGGRFSLDYLLSRRAATTRPEKTAIASDY